MSVSAETASRATSRGGVPRVRWRAARGQRSSARTSSPLRIIYARLSGSSSSIGRRLVIYDMRGSMGDSKSVKWYMVTNVESLKLLSVCLSVVDTHNHLSTSLAIVNYYGLPQEHQQDHSCMTPAARPSSHMQSRPRDVDGGCEVGGIALSQGTCACSSRLKHEDLQFVSPGRRDSWITHADTRNRQTLQTKFFEL